MPGWPDWIIVAAIVALANAMIRSAGLRRGLELMPWPDGLEYAAAGENLAAGRGAVLHFGGYTYPSRYTGGYPLILEFFRHLNGADFRPLYASMILGMLSVLGVYMLTRGQFWRLAATIAALLLALSPVFITYSSLVMSDVPTLFVTICAAVMLVVATSNYVSQLPSWMRMSAWLMFGLLAGFSTIIRPSNAVILVGLAVCVVMVPLEKRDLPSLLRAGIAIAAGFAIPVAWQLHQNSINLGSAFASGYTWWVPEVYGAGGTTFSAAYLFGPTMPRNPHGNVIVYATTLLGLDGMLGDRGDARYFLYPFAAAVFAIVGFIAIFRAPDRTAARRLMWFGLGYLAALTGLYCFYVFTDVAFILPGAFILFIAAGCGRGAANRWMRAGAARTESKARLSSHPTASVIVLDLLLVVSLASEAAVRLSAQPATSAMVDARSRWIRRCPPTRPSSATSRCNFSICICRRRAPIRRIELARPGRTVHRLPSASPVREARGRMERAGASGRVRRRADVGAAADRSHRRLMKTPVFLMLAAPESQQYADVLKGELDQICNKRSDRAHLAEQVARRVPADRSQVDRNNPATTGTLNISRERYMFRLPVNRGLNLKFTA